MPAHGYIDESPSFDSIFDGEVGRPPRANQYSSISGYVTDHGPTTKHSR
jgi:hypothetical protein